MKISCAAEKECFVFFFSWKHGKEMVNIKVIYNIHWVGYALINPLWHDLIGSQLVACKQFFFFFLLFLLWTGNMT